MSTTHIIVVSSCIAWALIVLSLLSTFTVAGRAERIAEDWGRGGHDPRLRPSEWEERVAIDQRPDRSVPRSAAARRRGATSAVRGAAELNG